MSNLEEQKKIPDNEMSEEPTKDITQDDAPIKFMDIGRKKDGSFVVVAEVNGEVIANEMSSRDFVNATRTLENAQHTIFELFGVEASPEQLESAALEFQGMRYAIPLDELSISQGGDGYYEIGGRDFDERINITEKDVTSLEAARTIAEKVEILKRITGLKEENFPKEFVIQEHLLQKDSEGEYYEPKMYMVSLNGEKYGRFSAYEINGQQAAALTMNDSDHPEWGENRGETIRNAWLVNLDLSDKISVSAEKTAENKTTISVVVGGSVFQKELSSKDYDKLLALDDYQRGKFMNYQLGLNLNDESNITKLGADVMAAIAGGNAVAQQEQSQSRPEVYKSEISSESVNVKEIVQANYSQMEAESQSQSQAQSQSRGMGM